MKTSGEWWVPDMMTGPSAYLIRSLTLPGQIARARQFRTCIQAGGHIGIYPKKLARFFARMLTFEPNYENFTCLTHNVTEPNIKMFRAFLGPDSKRRTLRHHSKSTGGHQTGETDRDGISTIKIDGLRLTDLDAIFLDVEGFEYDVISGALETIKKTHPLLVLEENKKCLGYGRQYGELEKLVAPLGYRLTVREKEDIVLEWQET